MLDSIFGKDGRHIALGIVLLTALFFLYLIATMAGFASIRLICYSFMAVAFVESEAVPRLSPVKNTKYDDSTPITSFILGNRTTTLSTSYLLVEIVVAALMVHFDMQRLALAFYIQAAMMIVYLSLVVYLTAHPGKSEDAGAVEDETPEDVAPAHSSNRHADDTAPISHDRVDNFLKGVRAALVNTKDPKLRRETNNLIEALKACPRDSYESMNDVDTQMAMLIGELGERVKADETDIALECVMLTRILCDQRTALYEQIVSGNREERKERRKETRARQAAARPRRKSNKKR